jgi:hypothetical protein
MKPRLPRAEFFARIAWDVDEQVRQYCDRTDTTLGAFAEEAFRRQLQRIRRRKAENVLDITPGLQKRERTGAAGRMRPGKDKGL